jgi:hypothetical protein
MFHVERGAGADASDSQIGTRAEKTPCYTPAPLRGLLATSVRCGKLENLDSPSHSF